jgi:Mrp family chromosome partitioning ATPase
MDKVRKALDIARLERTQAGEAPFAAETPLADAAHLAAVRTPLGAIIYSHTRTFSPPAGLLESNRILNPAASDNTAAFRMLRTQVLQRMNAQGWRTLGVFSPAANDGKTTMAINLAINLANDQHHTVLLVDFDFRNPTIAARLGLAPEFGVDDVLKGTAPLEDCLYHPDGFERLVVLPARNTLAQSSEILAGPRCRMLVAELHRRYADRILVFDLPPVLAADDALAFAPLVECGLVVVAEGSTRRTDLVRTVELLHKTPLVGTVLNRATDAPAGS